MGRASAATVAANIADYTKALSQAVKEIDPNILIIGPEYEYYRTDVYNILFSTNLTASDCIAGTITSGPAAGKAYIDYASYHYYLYNFQDLDNAGNSIGTPGPNVTPSSTSWNRDIVYTEIEKYKKDFNEPSGAAKRFRGAMRDLRAKCNAVTAARGIYMGWMLTETNSSLNNEVNTAGDPNGFDTRSMLGAQNIARIYALAMEYGAASVMMWSVIEGCNNSNLAQDRGYLDCTTGKKRGSWFHYEALAKYFKGDFLKDKVLEGLLGNDLATEPGPAWLQYQSPANQTTFQNNLNSTLETKAFAAKGADIAVMVLNHATGDKDFTIRLDGAPPTLGTATTKKFSFAAGINVEHHFNDATAGNQWGVIEGESTLLLIFDCNGNLKQKYRYRKSVEAQTLDAVFNQFYNNASAFAINTTTASTDPNNCLGPNNTSQITITGATGSSFAWYKLPSTTAFSYAGNAVAGLSPGAYRTKITGGNVCNYYDVVTVIHHNSPLVDAGPDDELCTKQNTQVGNVNLPGTQSYLWNTSAITNQITVSGLIAPASFVLTATAGQCTLSDDAFIAAGVGDVFIEDSPVDIGSQPNAETLAQTPSFYQSSGFWVRNFADGGLQDQNPIGGTNNTIYIKLRNRGCTVVNSGEVNVYFSKASTGIAWTTNWMNYSCSTSFPNCTAGQVCGNLIGTTPQINIGINSTLTQQLNWLTPSPANYVCAGGAGQQGHFCLWAHFNSASDDPLPSLPNGSDVGYSTYLYNNIAWKNVEIYDMQPRPKPIANFWIRNITQNTSIRLKFTSKRDENNQTVLDYGRVRMYMTKQLVLSWKEGGQRGDGVVLINDSVVEIKSADAVMDNIFMKPAQIESSAIEITPFRIPAGSSEDYFHYDIDQFSFNGKEYANNGGVSNRIRKSNWVINPCYSATNTLSGTISGVKIFKKDTLLVTGNVIVPFGAILKLKDLVVMIDENVKIKVQAGGTLTINHAELLSACTGKKWTGIIVNGNNLIPTTDLNVKYSNIAGTDNPITIDNVNGMKIIESSFIGDNLGTAISMKKMKDFEIYGNTFKNYEIGILSSKTNQADVKSKIEKNIFENVKIALQFVNDNHSKLDVRCNRFKYADYAILSDSTDLQDQGLASEGAGNEFITSSTLSDNKLKHTNGNAAKYYYDPNHPITNGMNVTTLSSSLDRTCYAYTFDTSSTSGSRIRSSINPVQQALDKKIMDLNSVPNPNSGLASVYYSLGEEKQGEVFIIDVFGKVLNSIKVTSESNKIDMDYSRYANGIYMLSLANNKGEIINKKIIIAK